MSVNEARKRCKKTRKQTIKTQVSQPQNPTTQVAAFIDDDEGADSDLSTGTSNVTNFGVPGAGVNGLDGTGVFT